MRSGRLRFPESSTAEKAIRPVTGWAIRTDAEYRETEATVAAFLAPESPAHALQAALAEYDAREDVHIWLDDFWRTRYVGRRDRIAVNATFFFLFEDSPLGQVERAAELISGARAYKQLLDEERLEPAAQRGQPLSMQQYRYLFSATRIPGAPLDTVRAPYRQGCPGPSRERHIVVLHNGRIVALTSSARRGCRTPPAEIAEALRNFIAATAQAAEPDTAVGHLTTAARATWAASRQGTAGRRSRQPGDARPARARAALRRAGGSRPRRCARGRG